MSVGVIISAYKDAHSLDKVLTAYSVQTLTPDEIIIAEDGQSQDIFQLVKKWKSLLSSSLLHITQKDNGFRKNRILNKAIKLSNSHQLIFTDQDILPRNDFVAMHVKLLKPNCFISGGSHLNIKQSYHNHLCDNDIINQNIFDKKFLYKNTLLCFSKLRLVKNPLLARFLDFITPRNAFIGCNSSAFREDLVEVSGFDEYLLYGGEDLNIGIRLNNKGCKGKRYRYSLVCLHLDHSRSYVDKDKVIQHKEHNKKIRKNRYIEPQESIFL